MLAASNQKCNHSSWFLPGGCCSPGGVAARHAQVCSALHAQPMCDLLKPAPLAAQAEGKGKEGFSSCRNIICCAVHWNQRSFIIEREQLALSRLKPTVLVECKHSEECWFCDYFKKRNILKGQKKKGGSFLRAVFTFIRSNLGFRLTWQSPLTAVQYSVLHSILPAACCETFAVIK